jgi:hypothetical protein
LFIGLRQSLNVLEVVSNRNIIITVRKKFTISNIFTYELIEEKYLDVIFVFKQVKTLKKLQQQLLFKGFPHILEDFWINIFDVPMKIDSLCELMANQIRPGFKSLTRSLTKFNH